MLEIDDRRVLTDPGAFSDGFKDLSNLDLILITHEHADHLHTDSLKALVKNNPKAEIITNESVGKILDTLNIEHDTIRDKEEREVAGLRLKAYDGKHVEIIGNFGLVQNTGFLLEQGKFFYPGDAYTKPNEEVRVLAAPAAGPWCKVGEAIPYALSVKPRVVIPVHDAVLSKVGKEGVYAHFSRELGKVNIDFIIPQDGETVEL